MASRARAGQGRSAAKEGAPSESIYDLPYAEMLEGPLVTGPPYHLNRISFRPASDRQVLIVGGTVLSKNPPAFVGLKFMLNGKELIWPLQRRQPIREPDSAPATTDPPPQGRQAEALAYDLADPGRTNLVPLMFIMTAPAKATSDLEIEPISGDLTGTDQFDRISILMFDVGKPA